MTVRLQPDLLDLVDTWIRQQDPQPSRPEAMRRIADAFLKQPGVIAPHRPVPSPVPPFDVGDRVQSRHYGAGTVVGPITAVAGADPAADDGVRDAGWSVPVRWDAAEWGVVDVRDFALTRICADTAVITQSEEGGTDGL